MKKVLVILGTRPEAIKFAPLVKELKANPNFHCELCSTGQHREMLEGVFKFFDLKADYDLQLMKANQSLFDISSACLSKLKPVLEESAPDLVFVQGDTSTAFIASLAAFYLKIPVAHLEAGLRSGDLYSPFPEEANRKLISQVAQYHFVPTDSARNNLMAEGFMNGIYNVGNTVIDALFYGLQRLEDLKIDFSDSYKDIDFANQRVVLLTAHRRESFGKPFKEFLETVKELADKNEDVQFIFPVHLNPNVRKHVFEILDGHSQIKLIDPVDYPELIWLMSKSWIIMTDSGGIQEEAPSLGKPILVLREVTERMEGVENGTAQLVGMNPDLIKKAFYSLYDNKDDIYNKMSEAINPYGDGETSKRIASILSEEK